MTATMTVLGLYQWDDTLFNLLTVPAGLDQETAVDTILAECSDLETLYPNPEVLKGLIGVWSNTMQYTWAKLYATMTAEYNPLDNYDRTETRTYTSQAAGTVTDGGTDTVTSADTGTDATTGSSTNVNQVKAFDTAANTFTDREKDTVNNTGSTTYGKTTTNTTRYGHTNNNAFSKNDSETIRARGNIGVMSSQELLERERSIAEFNIYNVIMDEFKKRFCILVY